MSSLVTRKCSCGKSDYKTILKLPFVGLLKLDEYQHSIVECENCNQIYCNPIPSDDYFMEHYKSSDLYTTFDNNPTTAKRLRGKAISQIEYAKSFQKMPKSFLDIGASNGFKLSVFKEIFPDLKINGLEGSDSCIEEARKVYDIDLDKGFIDDLDTHYSPNSFDLISLSHILEHLTNPRKSLLQIKPFLSKDGLLYIEVPGIEEFKNFDEEPYAHFSFEHIQYYSMNSLEYLMNSIGFEKVDCSIKHLNKDTLPNYSCIQSIWKMGNKHTAKKFSDIPVIKEYISQTQKKVESFNKVLNKYKDKDIIIWGTGAHTNRLLALSDVKSFNILGYVDSSKSKQSQLFLKEKINAPEWINSHPTDTHILISSQDYAFEIEDEINKNFQNYTPINLYK